MWRVVNFIPITKEDESGKMNLKASATATC